MKYYKFLIFYFFAIISIVGLNIYATKPLPTAAVDKTTFPLIIPLTKHDLQLKKSEITINLLTDKKLDVNRYVEKKALVTMSYNIFNPSSQKQIEFVLPFISTFGYLTNPVEIKIDKLTIDNQLQVFGDSFFQSNNTFAEYIENFNYLDEVANYEFKNDIDGYLYTLTNPETKGKDYLSHTSLTFSNGSSNAIFVDSHPTYNGEIYSSKEVDYFFVSEDLDVSALSIEYKKFNTSYTSDGTILEQATIEKKPIKLSEYYEFIHFDKKYNGPFINEYISSFYKELDILIETENFDNYISTYTINDKVLNKYQHFSYKFDVNFKSNETSLIEVSYLTPIYCDIHDLKLEFIPNPQKQWNISEDINISVITNEKLLDSPIPYEQNKNTYTFKNIGKETLTVTFDHHLERPRYLIIFLIFFIILFLIIISSIIVVASVARSHSKRKSSV